VHGDLSGGMLVDRSLYEQDLMSFGHIPGVNIFNVPDMSPEDIQRVMRSPGTTIGGFCNSGPCLTPYK
jgi:hypothetical protein